MENYKCLIYVEFYKNGPRWLFGVPAFKQIKKGTELKVDTINGSKEAFAATNSFIVDDWALKNMLDSFNKKITELKYVEGFFENKKEFVEIENLNQNPIVDEEYLPF